jgi:hypothetical protein
MSRKRWIDDTAPSRWPLESITQVQASHLFPDDDGTEDMAALGALAAPKPSYSGNVVPLHG